MKKLKRFLKLFLVVLAVGMFSSNVNVYAQEHVEDVPMDVLRFLYETQYINEYGVSIHSRVYSLSSFSIFQYSADGEIVPLSASGSGSFTRQSPILTLVSGQISLTISGNYRFSQTSGLWDTNRVAEISNFRSTRTSLPQGVSVVSRHEWHENNRGNILPNTRAFAEAGVSYTFTDSNGRTRVLGLAVTVYSDGEIRFTTSTL